MELLPAYLRASLPVLYSQESNPDPWVHLKFFTPPPDRRFLANRNIAERSATELSVNADQS